MSDGSSTTINVSCGADKLKSSLESVASMMSSVLSATQDIESNLKNMYENLTEMADVVIHIHDAHLHFKSHTGEERYDVGVGAAIMPSPSGFGDRLVAEYNNGMDLDGNGMAFGKDFLINESDPSFPPILSSLMVIIPKSVKKKVKKISWATYMNSLPGKGQSA